MGGIIRSPELTYPPREVINVDISSADHSFDPPIRGFSVGTAGALKVDTPSSSGVTIPANALAIGIQHILIITKIYKVGTAAAEIVAWR